MFVTQAIEHAGLPPIHLSDGPHGLRKQMEKQDFIGQNESIVAPASPPSAPQARALIPR